jgi:prepilin-type N-terminal cleavage/methylation domain-containing protein
MQHKHNAFTLIEAILTVAVIGILAAVILPRFIKGGFIQGPLSRSAVSVISADIRYTRRLAVTHAGHFLIRFDFNAKEYRIYKDSISPANQVGETKKVHPDILLSGTEQFDFYSLGNAIFSGTGLNISTDETHQYRLAVEPPSGAVFVEKLP